VITIPDHSFALRQEGSKLPKTEILRVCICGGMGSFGATGVGIGSMCSNYHKSLIKVAEVLIHPEKIMCFNFITLWVFFMFGGHFLWTNQTCHKFFSCYAEYLLYIFEK